MIENLKNKKNNLFNVREKLISLLEQDLDFHGENTNYGSHNFHSFPAKFPPQLPKKFIYELTEIGDTVLDPMVGSGTTVLEAFLAGRRAIGVDIDPLALMISRVKVTHADKHSLKTISEQICSKSKLKLETESDRINRQIQEIWDVKTKEFMDYWFSKQTQAELYALVEEIEKLTDQTTRDFFTIAFSSIIITKSGGVSLALDLGHTRPHKAKVVNGKNMNDDDNISPAKKRILSKNIGSAIEDFKRRTNKNLSGLVEEKEARFTPQLFFGNAQKLDIEDNSIDLIVTSPPYASNAIDYMRAHKFSLVWLGNSIEKLSKMRKEYIGSEVVIESALENLLPNTTNIINKISKIDSKKGKVLHSYYSEMFRVLKEMHRILKNGKVAIVVVGTSQMRSINTETAECFVEIGKSIGFEVPKISIRSLDRNRRMLPIGGTPNLNSLIQQRMYEEYVIGFLKL